MLKYMHLRGTPLLMTVVWLAACTGEKKSDTLAQDSTLNRDMQLAGQDTTVQPKLNDAPLDATPAPAKSRPAPRPAPKPTTPRTTTTASGNTVTPTPGATEQLLGTIAAGSTVNLATTARVCTNTNKVGDHINATVSGAVSGSNGAVIPAGANVVLEITQLKRSENSNDKIEIGFRPVSVTFGGHTYPLAASVNYAQVDRVKNQPGAKDAQKVGVGAVAGAVLGRVLGKSTKATVIGGAVGAAAGAGAAAATANYEGCVPEGGRITIVLSNAVQVRS